MSLRFIGLGLAVAAALFVRLFVIPHALGPGAADVFYFSLLACLLFGQPSFAFIAAIIGGTLVDLMSPYPFGTSMLAGLGALAVTRWIAVVRITNRSLFAYVSLMTIGVLLIWLGQTGLSIVLRPLDPGSMSTPLTFQHLLTLVSGILGTTVLSLVLYLLVRVSGRRYATLADHEF